MKHRCLACDVDNTTVRGRVCRCNHCEITYYIPSTMLAETKNTPLREAVAPRPRRPLSK